MASTIISAEVARLHLDEYGFVDLDDAAMGEHVWQMERRGFPLVSEYGLGFCKQRVFEDEHVPKKKGGRLLWETEPDDLAAVGCTATPKDFQNGGVVILDARVDYEIKDGYAITFEFATDHIINGTWPKLQIPAGYPEIKFSGDFLVSRHRLKCVLDFREHMAIMAQLRPFGHSSLPCGFPHYFTFRNMQLVVDAFRDRGSPFFCELARLPETECTALAYLVALNICGKFVNISSLSVESDPFTHSKVYSQFLALGECFNSATSDMWTMPRPANFPSFIDTSGVIAIHYGV
ncbi:hypothetical protein NLG97_g3891 [Lecanicillium saksenae]|uniref:Uncharacterized protein n=1 Tax=Lecanicillium saksenae TaxID=468837 RepID=A0ACC1QXE5_9HYPO|nr:hypothetical protein NLG97_g3891 [Lecanicillium saksenae]